MKRFLKSSLSLFLAITIIFSSTYVGLSEVDFSKVKFNGINFSGVSEFIKALTPDFFVKSKAASESDLTFELDYDGKSYVVSSCKKSAKGSLTIPAKYNGKPVTTIRHAFKDCTGLTSVKISKGIKNIYSEAFSGCTNLKSVTIPNTVTSIGTMAFCGCTSLTSIKIPGSVSEIGYWAFTSCTNLTSVSIEHGVKEILGAAFTNCTKLKSINIPSSVTFIEYGAIFAGCSSLTAINVASGNANYSSVNGVLFNKKKTIIKVYPAGKTSTSYTIPGGVKEIAGEAFMTCKNLESVIIPNTVKTIYNHAFYECTKLKSITISDSVTSIGDYVFYNCKNLKSIKFPNSVTSLGEGVVTDCTNLRSITIPKKITSIDLSSSGCKNLSEINVDKDNSKYSSLDGVLFNKDKTTLVKYPLGKSSTLYKIPGSVNTIGSSAFLNCKKVKAIEIPNSVKVINSKAFYNCSALETITISDSVTKINDSAFKNCTGLQTVNFSGTKSQWQKISIGANNDKLLSAKMNYNSVGKSDTDYDTFIVSQSYDGKEQQVYSYKYDDTYFSKLATEYNHKLATMSLCLALSSFHLESTKVAIAYENLSDLLYECGFNCGKPYNYEIETTPDDVGCYIAKKKIGNDTVIAVVVRSSGYGKEWASNFTLDYEGDHKGFNEAAEIVLKRIESYINDYGLKGNVSGNLKIWITGYSRGAATATQTAAKIYQKGICGTKISKEKVYAYGFATPAGAIKDSDPTNLDKFGNIFNIINFHDLVPRVAPEKWHFGRYGRTCYLPFSENSSKAPDKEKKVIKWFKKKNLEYKIGDFKPLYIEGMVLKDTIGVFSEKLVNLFATTIGSRALYAHNLQSSVRAIWTKKPDISLDLALVEVLKVLNIAGMNKDYVATAIAANSKLVEAHSAFGAYYLGWMQSLPSNATLDEYNDGSMRCWLLNCPVDVYIYDTENNLVAAIENDVPVEIDGSTISYGVDENGQKYVYLPVDCDYNLTVKAREECETTCTVNEFAGGSLTESRVVTFSEIPMEKDEELSVSSEAYSSDDISEGTENGSSVEYTIQRENENTIEADVDVVGEEIESYTYNVTVEFDENKGDVQGGGNFTIGQFCQVTAANKPGYKFRRWTVNGHVVSTDSEYRFAVKEDVTIVAEYITCKHSKYINKVIAPTCTEAGYTKHTCKVCTYSYNDTIVEAKGHTSGSWSVDKEATVYRTGKKIKKCTECDEVLKTATISQLKCSKPTLKKMANTSNGIKITWSKVRGGDSYRVYRKTKGGEWKYLDSTKNLCFTDKTAKSGTTYYYTVKAKNESGLSSYNTKGLSIKYVAAPKLSKIQNATGGLKITWSKVSGADGYYVYRKLYGAKSWTRITTVKGGSTVTYKDTKVSSGKVYVYTVKAYDGSAKSALNADGIKLRYLAVPTLKLVSSTTKGVKLTWSKVTGAEGYYVYRKKGTGDWKKIATINGNAKVTYLDISTKTGKTYKYTVKAFKGATCSYYDTKGSSIKYVAAPKLSKIQNATGGLKITWSKVSGADGYYVYRKLYGAKSWTQITTVKGGSTLTYKDTKVSSGKVYVYTVKAYDGSAKSALNADGIKLRYLAVPALKSVSSTTKGVKLTWSKTTGAEGYIIYRKTGSGSYTKIKTEKGVSNLSYTDSSAKKGKKYTYKIKAYKSSTYSAYSNTKTITDKY